MAKFSNKEKLKNKKKPDLTRNNLFDLPINYFSADKIPYYLAGIYFLLMIYFSFSYHKIGDYGVETDFYEGMVYEAKELLRGNLIIEGFKGPLYPILLAILSLVFKDFFAIGVFVCVLSASLFLFFTFKSIERAFSPVIAFYSVLLIASNSIFIQYSYSAGTDLFYCFLSISSVYLLLKDDELKNRSLFLAGVIASLAFLTRTNGLALPVALVVSMLIFIKHFGGLKTILLKILIYLGGFIILNIPWSVYKYIQKGDFFYDQNFKNTAWALYGEGKVPWDYFNAIEAPKFNTMFDVFSKDPVHFIVQIFFVNFYKNFSGDLEKLLSPPFAIALVIGLIFLFLKKYSLKQSVYLLNILFGFILLLPAFYSERFSLFLLAGYSLIVILFLKHDRIFSINSGFISLLLFLVIFSWSLVDSVNYNSRQIDIGPKEVLDISKKVPENIKSEENLVVARKPQIGYQLNMQYRKIPFVNNYDSLLAWLYAKNANYFYVSAFEAQTLISYATANEEKQKFYELINPETKKRGLEVVTQTDEPPSVLYKIIKQ